MTEISSSSSQLSREDPNLLQRRQSLFASSEAQSIIEEMTGVSCIGQAVLKKAPETESPDPSETAPAVGASPENRKGPKDVAVVPEANGTSKAKGNCSSPADAARSTAMRPRVYRNDRPARAVKRWRSFQKRKNGEISDQKDTEFTSPDANSNDKADISPACCRDSTEAKGPDVSAAAGGNTDGDGHDKDVETEPTTTSSQPGIAPANNPAPSSVLNRPARGRFGRRYSVPVIWTGAPPTSLAGSPPHASPRISREASPRISREASLSRSPSPSPRRTSLTAGHLQNNREKLSALLTERSAIISSLAQGRKDGTESKVLANRLSRRRASDTTESLSEFLQQRQTKSSGSGTAKLLQRRGSISTVLHGRPAPARSDTGKSLVFPGSSCDKLADDPTAVMMMRVEGKSRSCENVSSPRLHTRHPPATGGFSRGRRGSVCVGRIARTTLELPSSSVPLSPLVIKPSPPGEPSSGPGVSCTDNEATDEQGGNKGAESGIAEKSHLDEDFRHNGDHLRPSDRYFVQRRASVSTAHIARARERMLEWKPSAEKKDSNRSELSESAPLTLQNIKSHNTILTPFSLQLSNARITPIASSCGELTTKHEDLSRAVEASPVNSRPTVTDDLGPSGKDKEADDDEGNGSFRRGRDPTITTTPDKRPTEPHPRSFADHRRYSLFLRTDSEIKEDVETELQERVARRRRELVAARCVSVKGIERLEARALAQSAAGRLKRNLHELTKQRKAKELMQIEEERKRLMKQMFFIS